jgi:hypothetical protein
MSHEIWGDKFVAVRTPAWHGIGQIFDRDVVPTEAAAVADLLYVVDKYPLVIEREGLPPLDTGLIMVGRVNGDELVNYGVASEFDMVTLSDVLPRLDDLAVKYPLSAAGALRKGAEAFFTFTVSESSEIVGEEYQEFLTVVHSYTPGVAHRFIYSPVRVVCQNTLVMSEAKSSSRVRVAHTAKSAERLDAAYIVSDAMAQAAVIKKRLTQMAKTPLSDEAVKAVIEDTYARYRPTDRVDSLVMDLVSSDVMTTLMPKHEGQQRYYDNLVAFATQAYAIYNEQYPKTAGTAYGLYQSIVEVADFRKGKSETGSLESAVVGVKAAEKKTAWQLLSALTA